LLGLVKILPIAPVVFDGFDPVYAVTRDADGNPLPLVDLSKKISVMEAAIIWERVRPMRMRHIVQKIRPAPAI
jgi:hypothetical protein